MFEHPIFYLIQDHYIYIYIYSRRNNHQQILISNFIIIFVGGDISIFLGAAVHIHIYIYVYTKPFLLQQHMRSDGID